MLPDNSAKLDASIPEEVVVEPLMSKPPSDVFIVMNANQVWVENISSADQSNMIPMDNHRERASMYSFKNLNWQLTFTFHPWFLCALVFAAKEHSLPFDFWIL